MKTISALYLAVLVLTFTSVRCYPSDLDLTASEGVEGSGVETTTSTPETETESYDFDLPKVLKLFLNDTSNTTKINGVTLTGDPEELDHVDYSVDTNYDYYYDNENDEKPSSVKVSKVVSLVLKPAPVKKENVSDSTASSIFEDESEGNETDTSEIPPIIFSKTITFEKDLTGNDTETSTDETGRDVGERDVGDAFSSSGIPAFGHAAGASDTTGTEQLSSPVTFGVAASEGFSSSSNVQDPSSGGTSFSSGIDHSDSAGHSSPFDGGAISSKHRREAPEFDDDYEESESSTDINVHASVSSSAGNYNRKIYETVSTDLTQGSFSPSSNAEYDQAPQTFGSESGFEPSFSDGADQSNTYPGYETEGEEGEFTTQAAYDEEAALVQRQRIAELRRKFLEDESQAAAANADEETETATDYEYSDGLATETPALSLLPDAHRVIYY